MRLAVVERGVKPVEGFLLAGVLIKHERGDEDLVMRPPELHVMLVCLGRFAERVNKVQQPAVFLVPSGGYRPIEYFLRLGDKRRVTGFARIFQQEPHALNVMPGVNNSPLSVIQSRCAVNRNVFQHAPELRVDMVAENIVHAGRGALGVERCALRIDALHHGGNVEIDHRDAEGAPRARGGLGFRAETGRVGHAVVEIPVEVICAPRALEMLPLAGHAVILRVRHGVKCLGKAVPALAERRTLGGDGKVHPVPGGAVYAVRLHKVETAF